MKNTFGTNLSVTVFGESHGPSIGVVLDGLPAGLSVEEAEIREWLSRRRPSGAISTARRETDAFTIESGVFEGKTTGTPLSIRIPNADTRSEDYAKLRRLARPSHADYTAHCKYHGYEDFRGGGHFSGRITAALVAAGAVVGSALRAKGIRIGTHIARIGNVEDRNFEDLQRDIEYLCSCDFAALDESSAAAMRKAILAAAEEGDSVGGVLETAVTGIEAGLGEPWFDTVEGLLSHALFSVPAIKGVEFGAGFALAQMYGSQANDPLYADETGIHTATNHSGGINGGITNGMPLSFRCVVRPTPTIRKPQRTIDMERGENATLVAEGRHDPCIVHRARIVVDAVTALTLCDLLIGRHGADWLVE